MRSKGWSHHLRKAHDSTWISPSLICLICEMGAPRCSLRKDSCGRTQPMPGACPGGGVLIIPKQGRRANPRCQRPSSSRSKSPPPQMDDCHLLYYLQQQVQGLPQAFRTCHFPLPSKDSKQAEETNKLEGAVRPAPGPSPLTPYHVTCTQASPGLGTGVRSKSLECS